MTEEKCGLWVDLGEARGSARVDRVLEEGRQTRVDGFGYLAHNCKVWWGPTTIVRGGQRIVLAEHPLVLPLAQRASVRFRVKGLRAGAKVEVLFEDRSIVVAPDGSFTDDLRGENVYDDVWLGRYGDKLSPHVYYGGGYGYTDNHAAVRVYELPLQ